MHGVPQDLNLAAFENTILDHIIVARFMLAFGFESEASLSIEGKWELLGPDGSVLDQGISGDAPVSEHGPLLVHQCVGRRVESTNVNPPDSISLKFEGGLCLRVSDTPGYESFHIEPGNIHV